jgi:hypothetical protein
MRRENFTRGEMIDLLPRLENAVEYLLFGQGCLRRRLAGAYGDYLSPLRNVEFPAGRLRSLFDEIHSMMTSYELPAQPQMGKIEAAGHLMSGPRARATARKVFALYTGVVVEALRR